MVAEKYLSIQMTLLHWHEVDMVLSNIDDVGFPSVCYEYVLLPLVNKEAAFGQWLNRI